MSEQKKYMTTLLDIRLQRVTDKKTGKPKDVPKVQLGKDVELYYKGKKVDMGKYNSAFLKKKDELIADADHKLENEWIDEDKHSAELEYLEEKRITAALKMKL